ncbi:HlyD family secretion protein [Marinobacter sp. 1-3A]|uniref:HlyD family secretion protein n=1 Tax=Marinobacter sp. 1-3A TaxID=2582920 RepID=UPI0019083A3A|nr:HlyD family secretion protein [Marinobacter sp. 1-3A]MBK1875041.1 HlyD family secretion protein [Marinobacter sp. 1-3A]
MPNPVMRMSHIQGRVTARLLVTLVSVVVLLLLVAQWFFYRVSHVHVVDARIKSDMVAVASRLPGWLEHVAVNEGDEVAKSQSLVTIDSGELRLELEVLVSRQATLRAEQNRLDAELAYVAAVDRAELLLAEEAVARAQIELNQANLELKKAAADLRRLEGMTANAMVSAQQLADAVYRREQADVKVSFAGSELRSTKAALEKARASLARKDVLAGQKGVVTQEIAELDAEEQRLRLRLQDHSVRSPLSGRVTKVFVEQGEFVQVGQTLMLAYSPDSLWVEANVKETVIRKVSSGQAAVITVDAMPEHTFQGEVIRVGYATTSEFALIPSPNPSGNFTKTTQRIPVRIRFDAPDQRLRPGMMVEVGIRVRD